MINIEQRAVVCVQVRAHFGVDARRAFAFLAYGFIASPHLVHIGGGAAQITEIPFEVR